MVTFAPSLPVLLNAKKAVLKKSGQHICLKFVVQFLDPFHDCRFFRLFFSVYFLCFEFKCLHSVFNSCHFFFARVSPVHCWLDYPLPPQFATPVSHCLPSTFWYKNACFPLPCCWKVTSFLSILAVLLTFWGSGGIFGPACELNMCLQVSISSLSTR